MNRLCIIIRFVCIAEDIIDMKDTVTMIDTIVDYCKENSTLVVQCFKRRKLARLFKRGQMMSCLCILKDAYTNNSEFKNLQKVLL